MCSASPNSRWSSEATSRARFAASRFARKASRSFASAASSLASALICVLRSSSESARTSLLPPKIIPSAEINSPAMVAIASAGSVCLCFNARSRPGKTATLPSNCLTSNPSDFGAATLSTAQAMASCGNVFFVDSSEGAPICGMKSAA